VRIRAVVGLGGAMAASVVGVVSLSTTTTTIAAAPAQQTPAQELGPITVPGFLPAGTFPNIKVTGNCPQWLFSDAIGFLFTSGNAHFHWIDRTTGQPNGGNVEGIAKLLDNGNSTAFSGQTHAWFGQSSNVKRPHVQR
jgi:hypothetical protein